MTNSKRKIPRAVGLKAFRKKTFKTYDFEGPWRASFGEPETNFSCITYGDSGNGKTDFVVQLAKYLAQFGKVYYDSFEEGESLTLQKAFDRHNLWDMDGKIILGDREDFDLVMRRMKARNSPRFCILDSLDYMKLTVEDYKRFKEELPHKAIIIISWSEGKKPKSQAAKDIEYMVDVKIRVHEFKAYMKCRFGGNQPFIIWPNKWNYNKLVTRCKVAGITPPEWDPETEWDPDQEIEGEPAAAPPKRSRSASPTSPAPAAAPSLFTPPTPKEVDDEIDDFFEGLSY